MDVACGTGRHALELAAMGWHVTGVDYNPELLERARESAATRGLEVAFLEQDMRELDVDGRPFDVGHVLVRLDRLRPGGRGAIVEALRGMAKHLHAERRAGGRVPPRGRGRPTPFAGEGAALPHPWWRPDRAHLRNRARPPEPADPRVVRAHRARTGRRGLRACDGDAVQPLLLPRGDARADDPGRPRRARNRPRVRGRCGHLGR